MKSAPSTRPVGVEPIFHLVTADSRGQPLCGASSSDALIGSYVEHLDTSGEEVRWVREVFGTGGKPAKACDSCLDAYPSELKQITPFSIAVAVQFEPDQAFSGYNISASAIAQIGNKRESVEAYPLSPFVTAKRLHRLHLEIAILADSIVPWIHKANKE